MSEETEDTKDLSLAELSDKLADMTKKSKIRTIVSQGYRNPNIKTILLTTGTVKALDWLSDPNFWMAVDYIYKNIKYWLVGV